MPGQDIFNPDERRHLDRWRNLRPPEALARDVNSYRQPGEPAVSAAEVRDYLGLPKLPRRGFGYYISMVVYALGLRPDEENIHKRLAKGLEEEEK